MRPYSLLVWHLRVLRRAAEQERRNEPIAGIDLVLTGMNGAYFSKRHHKDFLDQPSEAARKLRLSMFDA